MIKIISCHDSLLWYNSHIGEMFYPYREYEDSYLVRCLDGLSNIVYKTDCEVINEKEKHE